jgi:hypothetical protein
MVRVELGEVACERGDEAEEERRRSEQKQDQEEREQPQLADPPPRPPRGFRASSAQQNCLIVTLELAKDGHRRPHS